MLYGEWGMDYFGHRVCKGYRRLEDIEEEMQGTGHEALLTCTKDIQGRDWCKVDGYRRIYQ